MQQMRGYMEKSKKTEVKEKVYTFTLDEYNEWKNAGTNTGIVKDLTDWLDEKQKSS